MDSVCLTEKLLEKMVSWLQAITESAASKDEGQIHSRLN